MWIIYILIGTIIGFTVSSIINYIKKESDPKYKRRGILKRQYQVNSGGTKVSEFECQLEIGELERSDTKSKIVVIDYIPNGTGHSDENSEKSVRKLVDKSWVDSSEIEWITDSITDQRNKKLNEILK